MIRRRNIRATARAFMATEAVIGLALLGVISAAMLTVNSGYNRLARSLSDQRTAMRNAEAALAAVQAHRPVPDALRAKVLPLPTEAPPGTHWVSVEAIEKKRTAVLVGLVKGAS